MRPTWRIHHWTSGQRGALRIALGAISLLLGLAALLWPGVTLLVVAMLFGLALITAGLVRIVAAVTHGVEFVRDIRKVEDDYRAKSRLVTLDEWLQRPRMEQAFDNLMRLTSALM